MKNQDNTDGWNDGWHTQASTGDSVSTLRDSILGTAKAAFTSAAATARGAIHDTKAEARDDGWSGGHATASPRESLSTLRDSSVEAAKSTAKMATTREGWWKIARGAGKVAAATAAVGFVVVRNALQADLHDEAKDLPCHADPSDPRNQPHSHIYYDHAGYPMDRAGFYHDDDDI